MTDASESVFQSTRPSIPKRIRRYPLFHPSHSLMQSTDKFPENRASGELRTGNRNFQKRFFMPFSPSYRLYSGDILILFLSRNVVPADIPSGDAHLEILVLLRMLLGIA